ncbi:rhomboid family intramembrane serine protease [Limosilactobacillus secaliphilus]|uniref:rhomboid family intramembrane serine protease n=1 Tax=Limosilactobacillus secaliphilus TaxID=396268 RepID=UPI00070E4007|nr:rhomboid family intramembrane serine protease [Limosilactobacillus secaliphilus]
MTNRFFKAAPVTVSLIAINVLVFLWLTVNGGSTSTAVLVTYGAKYTPLIVAGQWWRLMSAGFLHIGIEHLVINMLTLYFLGLYLENILGSLRMLLVYLASIIGGNLLSAVVAANSVSAGASTGIFGLFGAFIFLGAEFHDNPLIHQLARQFLILVIFNLVADLMPGIDMAGHIGGLLTGFLMTAIVGAPKLGQISLIKRLLSGTILVLLVWMLVWRGLL